MPRGLTEAEEKIVLEKQQDVVPDYYHAVFSEKAEGDPVLIPISKNFENYLILLPDTIQGDITTILGEIVTDTTDREARGELAEAFINNSQAALDGRAAVYQEKIDKIITTVNAALAGKTRVGTDILSFAEDTPESGYMVEDMKFTLAELNHHWAAANFMKLSLATSLEQWKDSFLPEERQKQMQSWVNIISVYMG